MPTRPSRASSPFASSTSSTSSGPASLLARSLAFGAALALPLAAHAEEAKTPRIVGGVIEGRFPAVGALVIEGEWFCSGTVIAPRLVLTAAHCLEGLSPEDPVEFFVGPDANRLSSGRTIPAASAHAHPDYLVDDRYDIGVLVLARDAGVTPIPARFAPLTDAVLGKTALFVGYGVTSATGDGGEKRSVEIPINVLDDFFVGYDQVVGKNTCSGDSGGPALMDLGHGLEVVGVTSYGDAECAFDGYNTRTDVFASWIGDFLEGQVPPDPEDHLEVHDQTCDPGQRCAAPPEPPAAHPSASPGAAPVPLPGPSGRGGCGGGGAQGGLTVLLGLVGLGLLGHRRRA